MDTSHVHCPDGCAHPQPVFDPHIHREICGRCWHKYDEVVECVPCTPETCGEEGEP